MIRSWEFVSHDCWNLTAALIKETLAKRCADEYALDPRRGHGNGAHEILRAICKGRDWRKVSAAVFNGAGSMGNGVAMRVGLLIQLRMQQNKPR